VKIESVASFSPIVRDGSVAQRLYRDVLGLSFEGGVDDYVYTGKLPGAKHFGLWPLSEAAESCFGVQEWPSDVAVPQASVEFEVGSVAEVNEAEDDLRAQGYELLHPAKEEPWGQTITRLLSQDGLIVGVCYTPWFHE
jgi:catechol 2,3-dioxygenase-like lactoylglutathione lyase family enzyme